jgi:magnesium transporter
MILYYDNVLNILQITSIEELQKLEPQMIWVDVVKPNTAERNAIEKKFHVRIPSVEEISEIELSNCLYFENDSYYLTVNMVLKDDQSEYQTGAVTFILSGSMLMTVRYCEPYAFKLFNSQVNKGSRLTEVTDQSILVNLLESAVYNIADILERAGERLDKEAEKIFRTKDGQKTKQKHSHNFESILREIGINGQLISKTRESLVSFSRVLSYLTQLSNLRFEHEIKSHLVTLMKDITSLSDHAMFLSNKINFLLDATLGMVSIEQNRVIKIFSVAAVIFLPPTLIASIYGMNFTHIPELSWKYGYIFALAVMSFSAWLPYKFFKKRKWL